MLGFVKNIINRSGEKKDSGFYLQLDETGNVVEADSPSQPATPAAKQEEKEVKPAQATTEAPVAEKKKLGKTSIKKTKSEAKAKTTETVATNPVPAVKPATPPEPEEKNFATKYLTTTNTMSRRRPGANMNNFLEMARQVKVPMNK